ncbi:MAG: hypothetical protein KIH63_003080 [Candidatus Saccharibacteria bacterium]|nr:hypothetical protein [Candidatus Saccharibacteria bacterium]
MGTTLSASEVTVLDGGIDESEVAGVITDVTAGGGLTGGGASGNVTLDIGAGNGITVNANDIAVIYGSAANTSVQGNVSLTCPSGTGNLTGGGTSITLGTGGSCADLNTVNNPSFTTSVTTPILQNAGLTIAATGANSIVFQTNGSTKLTIASGGDITATNDLTVQGGAITAGTTSQAGTLVLSDGSSSIGTLQVAALGQDTVYTLPDPGAGTVSICLTSGNCAGTGGGVTTAGGNANRVAKFTGAQTIGDSTITDDGTDVSISGDFTLQGGDVVLGTSSTAGVLNTANTSAGSTDSQNLTIRSGNATGATSDSGNVSIDAGTATGTTGTISLGASNASSLTLGRVGASFTLQGNQTSQIIAEDGSGNTTVLAFADPTADVTLNIPALGAGTYDLCTTSGNCVGGGGGGAPNTAQYLVVSLDGTLSNERNLSAGTNIGFTDNGANGSFVIATVNNPTFSTSVTTPSLIGSTTLTLSSTGAGNDIIIDGADILDVQDNSVFTGTITANNTATFNSDIDIVLAGTENVSLTSDLAGSVNVVSLVATPSASAGTTRGFFVQQADSANTNGLDAGLYIDNADTNLAIPVAISIQNSGGGGYTNIFDIGGTTISSAEIGLLDGRDAALVDVNDAVTTAITGTGALNSGSITSGFGAIDTGADNITTSGTIQGGNVNATTALQTAGTNRVDASGNLVNIGNLTAAASITIASTGAGSDVTLNAVDDIILTAGGSITLTGFNCSSNANGGVLTTDASGNVICGDDDGGGSAPTLQTTYDNDVDGSNAIIALSSADDSIIIRNPASAGTDSGYAFRIEQLNTGGVDAFQVQNDGTGTLATFEATSTGTTATGILIRQTSTGAITTALDVSDAEIGTALAIGSNDIVTSGATISSTELDRLDGKDAALVDTNDAVATAITGTGALNAGSITSGFGSIDTGADNITTTGTLQGTTAVLTSSIDRVTGGALNIGQTTATSIVLGQNTSLTGASTFTSGTGTVLLQGNTDIAATVSFATRRGTTYTTAGSANDVAISTASLYLLDTSGAAQTITGIVAGRDGQQLTLVNIDAALTVTINDNDAASSAANRISTGLGAPVTLAPGAAITLVYDAATSLWRMVGGVAGGAGTCAGCANTALSNLSSTNINTALNATSGNLNLTTTTSGNIVLNSAGTIELQDNTNVTGAFAASTTITAGTGLTVTAGGASIAGNSTIATTAGNTLSLGNSTGALTVTGNSSTTFVINGTTVDATEFNLLNGRDNALVDTNDAVNTAITGTGALNTGSITSGFGSIDTGADNITTTGTVQGTTSVLTSSLDRVSAGALNIGASTATSIVLGQNTSLTGTATFTSGTGAVLMQGNTDVAATVSLATRRGTTYTTAGSANDVAISTASLYLLDTSGAAQTITGIVAGRDGQILTLVNTDAALGVTFTDNDAASSAANRISTGTGASVNLAPGAAITLVYDSNASLWRMVGGVAGGAGTCPTCANQQLSNLSSTNINTALNATSGNLNLTTTTSGNIVLNSAGTIELQDATNVTGALAASTTITAGTGLTVTAGGASITGNSTIATTAGNTLSIGNSTGALTVTGDSSTTFVINGTTVDATEFNLLNGRDNALVDTNDAVNTAITGTGALNTGSITSGFGAIDTGADNITTTGTVQGTTSVLTSSLDRVSAGALNIGQATATSIVLGQNTSLTGASTFTSGTGAVLLQGNTDVAATVSLATRRGTTYTTAGSANDVAISTASLYLLDTSGAAQTITGIVAGRDGQILTLVNTDAALSVTITDNDAASSAANRISTGLSASVSLAPGAAITLVYDAASSLWRMVGGVAGGNGTCSGCANQQLSNLSSTNINTALNATSGNLNLTTTTSGNIVLNSVGTIELQDNTNVTGAFAASTTITAGTGLTVTAGGASITGNSTIATTAGNTLSIGNSTGALTVTGNSSTTFVINGTTVDATEFNLLNGRDTALVDTNDAVSTAITGTGALNSGSITSGFGAIDIGADTITSGLINGQTISSAANFTGTLAVQGATLTVGTTTQAGSIVLNEDTNNNTVTINTGTQATGSFAVSFPANLAANDTFCLATAANCPGSGDAVTVNSTAATGANFLDTSSTSSVAGTTWSINTGSTPDDITVAIAVATGTTAGVVDANSQTFGGAKTFSALLTGNAGLTLSGASSQLTFSGVTTDITTGANETLTISPNGTGDVAIIVDANSDFSVNDGTDGVTITGPQTFITSTNAEAFKIEQTGTSLDILIVHANSGSEGVEVVQNFDVDGGTTLNGNVALGDAAADLLTVNATIQGTNALVFEGSSADANETTFAITNPTADRTITFPDTTGTVSLITSGSSVAGISAFVQGGNTWAGTATLGTNDANSLVLETNNTAALTINSSQAATFASTAAVQGASVTIGTTTQAGSLILNEDTNNNTVTINTGTQATGSFSVGFPTLAANDTFCLATAANCAGSGDAVTVNGAAASGANFLDTTSSGSVAGTTWTLNTATNPDDISIAIAVATGTTAGVVDANSQTFGGAKTFSALLTGNAGLTLSGASSQLTFSGVTTDITTASNQDLTIDANGTGILKLQDEVNAYGRFYIEQAASSYVQIYDYLSGGGSDISVQVRSDAAEAIRVITSAASAVFNVDATGNGTVTNYGDSIIGDANTDLLTVNATLQGTNALVFEGSSADANETTFAITNPTADRTITFPDATGTVSLVTSGSSVAGISAFVQDGNTWAGTATLGTNDANSLVLETNNTAALTINSTQQATFAGLVTGNAGLTLSGASSQLTFSGVTTDITTGANETLTVAPNGTGDVVISADNDSNLQVTGTITDNGAAQVIGLTLGNDANADEISGLEINATSAATGDADSLYGIYVGDLASANGGVWENGIMIGGGWDNNLFFDDISAIVGINDGFLQFQNTSTTELVTIYNSGGIRLNINGDLQTGGTSRLDSAGALSNITGYNQSSGLFDITAAVVQGTNALVFEGSSADANETTFTITNPTADRTITIPDTTGTLALVTSGSSVAGISAFIQGGNTWGGTATLGTNDANSLILETNNTTALTITSAQAATFAGDVSVNGNATLGDATSDTVTFTGRVNSDILPSTNDTYNLGSDSLRWANLFLGGETIHLGTSTTDEAAISYVTATDSLTIKNATDSTTALQVQRNTGSTPVLTVDTTNSKLVLRGINSDGVTGSELITSNAFNNATYWTVGSGWSGGASSVTGSSASGTVVATSSNVTIASGVTYQVQFTISSYSAGSLTVSFGGAATAGIATNGTAITIVATTANTNALTFTGTGFSGVISAVSVKAMTASNSVIDLQDQTGAVGTQIRGGSFGSSNIGIGVNANLFAEAATAFNNIAIGDYSLSTNTIGSDNVALGYLTLNRNSSGSGNVAIGSGALSTNLTGTDNIAIGIGSLTSNMTGNHNLVFGSNAANALISGSDNILIGYNVSAPASNTSNFLNIGESLYGDLSNDRIAIGTTTTSAARLTVTNSSSSDSIFVAQDNSTAVFTIANGGGATFTNETNSATAFRIQNATAADTLLTADTAARSGSGGNLIKIGNSTGTDTNTTILQLDGATAVPTTNLSALNGGLFYNTTTNRVNVIENGTVKVLCNQTDAACGGNSTTLQQSYDADADGSDATITLSSTDGSINITNPSSSGSTSAYVLNVNQQATGAVGGLDVQSSGTGNLLRVRDSTATAADVLTIADGGATTFRTQTDSVSAFQIQNSAGTNLMTVDSSYGSINYTAFSDFENGLSSAWGGFGKIGNLVYNSEDLDAVAWTATNVTVTADTTADPYGAGSTTADSLASSGSGTHTLVQTASVSGITAGPATFSVWVKTASGTQPFDLRIDSVAGTPTTGTARSFTATTTWKRYHVTQNFTGAITDYKPTIVISNHSSTIIAWGAQLMTGSVPAAYSYTSNDASYFAGTRAGLAVNGYINLAGCINFGQGDGNQSPALCGDSWDSVNGISINSRTNNLILTATSTNSVQFTGLNTDITTTGNEALTVTAAGSGDIVLSTDADTNFQITPSAASTVDLISVSATAGSGITTDNVDGLYINIEGGNGTSTDLSAINVDFDPITGSSDDTFTGIMIQGITGTAAVENGLTIGSGWDANLFFADTSTVIQATDGTTYTITDGTNTLLTLADAGTTGNLTLSGTIAVNGDAITGDSNLTINASSYVRVGDTATPGNATGDDDLFVEGQLEVDGTVNLDGSVLLDGAITSNVSLNNSPTITSTSNTNQYGIQNQAGFAVGSVSGGTLSNLYGMINLPTISGNTTTITNAYGLYSRVDRSGTNTITNLYGSYYDNGATTGVTNKYGLYVSNQNGGSTSNYNIFVDSDNTAGGSEVFSITSTGVLVSRATGNSATQLEVYDGSSTTVTLLVADSTNDRIYIGDTTADATGALLVLDEKNTSGDPTGVNGAMYYNSNLGKFRCYENGIWTNCSDPSSISAAIILHEDFFSTNVGNANTIGTHGWTNDNTVCTFSNLTYANSDTPDRPGVMDLSTSTSATGCTLLRMGQLNAWQVGGNTTIETSVRVPTLSTAGEEFDFRAGLSDGMAGQGTDGVYFEYDRNTSTNWTLVTAAGGTRTKVTNTAANCSAGGSATAVSAATWYRLKAVINSAGSQVDFYINDTFVGCSTTNIPSGTQATQPNIHIEKSAGTTSRSVEVDYYSLVRPLSTKR